jgi:RND family efflux transporter MFP subunit
MPDLPAPAPAKPAGTVIGALGIVEAYDKNIRVAPPVAGLVTSIQVEPWSNVKSGDLLFELDVRELRSQLPPAEAEIAVRATERDNARRLRLLAEKLRAGGSASAEELEERRDQLRVAEARLAAASAALEQIREAINLRTVRAPSDGTVLQVNARVGEFITPGANPPPVLLGATARLQVRVDVDEQLAPRLRPGMNATGYLKGDAATPIPMTFERIEPYVVPKQNLSGSSMERVDTRVLQVIYGFPQRPERPIYVGQQINLFITE